jgi:beta-lactamase regulating signal transducer with metallopeptidase domain
VAAEALLVVLMRLQLVGSAAIVVVLLMRPLVLRWLGPRLAYSLWLLVPAAVACTLLPARERVLVRPMTQTTWVAEAPQVAVQAETQQDPRMFVAAPRVQTDSWMAEALVALWLAGSGLLLIRAALYTRRLAADPDAGPALVGVLRPRLLLPRDFEARFDADERALILKHEQTHRACGHPAINALVELIRCASWFNPLAHMAATRLRADQEMACDATVLSSCADQAHVYGRALLKAQIGSRYQPLACSWTSPSARRLHERIALLDRAAPTQRLRNAGIATLAALAIGVGYAAWAQQPERIVTRDAIPPAVWTAASEAPAGALSTALEGERHDRAIALARQGSIDMVLFGTTNAEMFSWTDRGRPVWDKHFGALHAVNFGSQGTQRDSLLWRMRNGELSGFNAKLVIVQTWLGANTITSREDAAGTYAPVIAEIRKYQPRAKILLFADIPRGQLDRSAWRRVAKDNAAAFAPLVDNRNVFYVDMGERFFLADGRHNQAMWRFPGRDGLANVGMQTAGFEAWADELKPWIERFVL